MYSGELVYVDSFSSRRTTSVGTLLPNVMTHGSGQCVVVPRELGTSGRRTRWTDLRTPGDSGVSGPLDRHGEWSEGYLVTRVGVGPSPSSRVWYRVLGRDKGRRLVVDGGLCSLVLIRSVYLCRIGPNELRSVSEIPSKDRNRGCPVRQVQY